MGKPLRIATPAVPRMREASWCRGKETEAVSERVRFPEREKQDCTYPVRICPVKMGELLLLSVVVT